MAHRASRRRVKPDFGMFIGIIGIVLAVLFPLLQNDGIDVNWEWSGIAYAGIIVGSVWTYLVHAVPHYGKIVRYVGSILILIILGKLAVLGVCSQYSIQHPKPASLEIAIQTFPGLPEGVSNDHLKYHQLVIQNVNDFEIDNFYGRIQLPEPIIQTVETNSPPGTFVDWNPILTRFLVEGHATKNFIGPASSIDMLPPSMYFVDGIYAQLTRYSDSGEQTGIWQLSINKLLPHDMVTLSFLTTDDETVSNYISLANYQFTTNGLFASTVAQGDGKGGVTIHNLTYAFIVYSNSIVKPREDWHLGTNELRFYFEGIYQYPVGNNFRFQNVLVPFVVNTNDRSVLSLPPQTEDGRWRRVMIDYQ
jgi:hypothetical protein